MMPYHIKDLIFEDNNNTISVTEDILEGDYEEDDRDIETISGFGRVDATSGINIIGKLNWLNIQILILELLKLIN